MHAFGAALRAHLERIGTTRARFAATVGVGRSLITDIIAGRRAPPMARVDAWADALRIPKPERRQWRRLAALAHAHPEVQELVAELEAELARREQEIARLTTFARRVAATAGVTYDP